MKEVAIKIENGEILVFQVSDFDSFDRDLFNAGEWFSLSDKVMIRTSSIMWVGKFENGFRDAIDTVQEVLDEVEEDG